MTGIIVSSAAISEPKFSSRRLTMLIAGTALAVACTAGANILVLALSHRNTLHEVQDDLLRQSKTLSELVDHTFQSADLVLASVAEKVRSEASTSSDLQALTSEEFYSFLKQEKSELPQIHTLGVMDAEGRRLNHSAEWPSPQADRSSREYFVALKANPKLESFIGEPVQGSLTGDWKVVLSRPVTTDDGRLLGVVFASTVLGYFDNLFQSVALGDGYAATLLRSDGTLLARYPMAGEVGKIVPASALGKLADARHVVSRSTSPIDHQARIAAAYRLSRYPLIVAVTQNEHVAFAPWRALALAMGLVTSLIIALIVAAAYLLARSWKQQDRLSITRAELVKSEKVRAFAEFELTRQTEVAEQSMRLKIALENMSHGICMFDGDQRLIICNQKYMDVYGLSKEQACAGTHIRSILEHQTGVIKITERPEEYVAGRLSDIAGKKVYQLTHRFHDGRLIAVTHRPMPAGGWVSTHADVTEQVAREDSFRLLFDSSPVPMWVIDRESLSFLAVNDATIAHYGYSREQFMSMTVPELRPPEDRERFGRFLRALDPVQFAENVVQHRTSDGRIIDVSICSRALTYAGRAARLTAIHDITKAKRVENELRRTQKFLDAIIEHVPAPIMVKEVMSDQPVAECRYTLVNRAFEELFGAPRSQIVGKTVPELYPKDQVAFILAKNERALRTDEPILLSDHDVHTATNGTRICTATTVAVRDDSHKPQCLVTVFQDVTERKQAEDRIARMAHYDQLTNLANRRTFNETMEAAIAQRTNCGGEFTVLSLDLDGFKETNDTYGHLVGDALLFEVSRRLMTVAADAFVARVGGDEFALILDGGMQAASQLAGRILESFGEEVVIEGRKIITGATIGAAVYPVHGKDSRTLFSNADIALYRAKAKGRGSVVLFDAEMGEQVRERRALQDALSAAVEGERLHLHYQPQQKMSGETVGFEALLRWRDSERGLISPDVFIPIAEESGLIIPMSEWVLRQACREAASWRTELTIAVNVSPVQFRYGDLPALVHSILLETGLAARRLELEITEGVFIEDFSRAISILSRLKALGVRIALDDFGSGYSSLSYLHSFAFDKIKIDRAFVCDLEHNRHSTAIVHAVIDLGHSLHIPVLAEGVETAAQHSLLQQRGCDEVQGYLLGRPLPIEDYAGVVGREIIPHGHRQAS